MQVNRLATLFTLLYTVAGALPSGARAADDGMRSLAPVVVTATRIEHDSFDLPASIDVVGRERIVDGQARVNASEALVAVPGVVVQNRQNYAQDLQISSRGFGARSAFGVRGVKLYSDGIPATMPDGQGQAATFDLDMAERIEVLRGPFSAIYGNHAGGVIQLFTRDGKGPPTIEAGMSVGSYGSWKTDVNAQGEAGGIGYVLDTSRFSTDGYREHSAATRDQGMAKLSMRTDAGGRLVVVANGLRQDDTQDPLGLTWAGVQRDPRSVEAPALTFNTRKDIAHAQGGISYEHRIGENLLHLSAYAGSRRVIQFLAIPPAAQASPASSGGVIDFDRNFGGFGARWTAMQKLASGKLTTTAGVDYDRSRDDRQGYENFDGAQLGVRGALRRDERDIVTSLAPYLQAEWETGRWTTTAGLRHSRLRVEVDDGFLLNGNDSGSVRYARTTPVLGVLYKLSPAINLYASAARGFETPTLNELFYTGAGGGFNFGLRPARSTHFEAGAKSFIGNETTLNVAVFQARTRDELVVDVSAGGRTSYRNASSTLRQGAELALDTAWESGFSARLALTVLRAVYDDAGRGRLPGVPRATAYGELAWKAPASGLSAAVEALANSEVHVDDSNAQPPAPGYAIANVRVGAEQRSGKWRIREFVRFNNLFDRRYIGSVIVGDGNGRFYEPAPGRNWLLGVSGQYAF